MDEHNNDPHEQQLYAVFQSCLPEGKIELEEDNWLTLCHKLQLTEQSEELRSLIQRRKPEKRSISFEEFRAALLSLLGKRQELDLYTERNFTIDFQKDTNTSNGEAIRCSLLSVPDSSFNSNALNLKTEVPLDEDKVKHLWEKVNTCLKENVDSATMCFIFNCLGIPALPKQVIQCIFEKLDQNCDGYISLDEFCVIFRNKKTLEEQISQWNDESLKDLIKLDLKRCSFDILPPCKNSFTRNNSFLDMCKLPGISNMPLSADGGLKTSDICLTDITAILCDELKNLKDSLDCSAIQSHVTLLHDVLILYQEDLHSLNTMIENINSEKEKLRIDMGEANERVNTLVHEIDEQHVRQEEIIQNLRQQIEQRHTEIIQDLSSQLSSEREMSAVALKSKDDQIQVLQKEICELKSNYVNVLHENQILEAESENLRSQIQRYKYTNNELLMQIKQLAAEHDEAEHVQTKRQEEVIYLVDRIKQIQSEVVLLRDQNDELTTELETIRLRDGHARDRRQDDLLGDYSMRSMQTDAIEDKKTFAAHKETDHEFFLQDSTNVCCSSSELENSQYCTNTNRRDPSELIIKQLKNALANTNKSHMENCILKDEICAIIARLQTNFSSYTVDESDFGKSIACEIETEYEERANESLRDFVVPKHKNSGPVKRTVVANSNNDTACDNNDKSANQDSKNASQNKSPSLRDYPPRKEEQTVADHSKSTKEKDIFYNHCTKTSSEINVKPNLCFVKSEPIENDSTTNQELQELESTHIAEKKQLTERCMVLERSLELLKIEYDECEEYWSAKLEEERLFFEQEQKVTDEKFSELIAKMAEYEELISPVDKMKNRGRLSPIEEKMNLEQQYLDLEEQYERWHTQAEEEISRKDKEINVLCEKVKSLERPAMVDVSVQVTDDFIFPCLVPQSSYVPANSFTMSPSSDSDLKMNQFSENIRKLPDEFKLSGNLKSSVFTNDLDTRIAKEEMTVNHYQPYQIRSQYAMIDLNSPCNLDKPRLKSKKLNIDGKSKVLLKENNTCDPEYRLVQDGLKIDSVKFVNCQCMRSDVQPQLNCVNVNVLQNLNMRLQAQEHKKRQLQEYCKQQQQHIERILHRIMSQHQIEVCELQCLLRNAQEGLRVQFQTNAQQAEQLASADILAKDLYMENVYLKANIKRLQQHCHILTGFNAESTSI